MIDQESESITFTSASPPPSIFRCVDSDCTKMGFHLGTIISTAIAVALRKSTRMVYHKTTVECLGTLIYAQKEAPCQKPCLVEIRGELRA